MLRYAAQTNRSNRHGWRPHINMSTVSYDKTVPFYFTKREALPKVGQSVRAKVETRSSSAASYPIPKGTSGTVLDAKVYKRTRAHRRWALEVKWDIELTPTSPGDELNDKDQVTAYPRRKYEAEIIEEEPA